MSRKRPHVLFSFEKWCDFVPSCGPSSSWENFAAPLQATGLATFEVIHPDEYISQNGQGIDSHLLERCLTSRPDLLFILWYPDTHDYLNFQLDTLITIRRDLKIPVVAFWGDSQAEYWHPIINRIVPCVDFVVDGNSANPAIPYGKKHFHVTHPKDPNIYFNPGSPRDIDISFPGSVDQRPKRLETLEFLASRGINVYRTGGQREQFIDSRKYAEVYQRSKLTLGINDHGAQTIVGRAIESTLCGSLLLENAGMATDNWFRPMQDYVTYDSLEDLANKVQYFLSHDEERSLIAANGCAKATYYFNGTYFWSTIFEKALAAAPLIEAEALFRRNSSIVPASSFVTSVCRCYEVLAQDPKHLKTLTSLAELNYSAGLYSEARSSIDRCLAADPYYFEIFPCFIRLLRRTKEEHAIKNLLTQSERLSGEELVPAKFPLRGEIDILAGNISRGIEYFNAYLRMHPEDYVVAIRLSSILAEVGQLAASRQLLELLVSCPRLNTQLLEAVAAVYALMGDVSREEAVRARCSS